MDFNFGTLSWILIFGLCLGFVLDFLFLEFVLDFALCLIFLTFGLCLGFSIFGLPKRYNQKSKTNPRQSPKKKS